MGIELPGWLRGAAHYALGEDWPDGDETAMRRLADSWGQMAQQVDEVSLAATSSSKLALDAIEGGVHDALDAEWKKLNEQGLTKLKELSEHLQETLEEGAADIEKAKIDIIAALTFLAGQLVADGVLLVMSFGTSTLAAGVEIAATRATVRMILRELLEKLLTKEMAGKALSKALWEAIDQAAKNTLVDFGTQAVQMQAGHRKESSFDDLWRKDVLAGLAEGGTKGLLGKEGFGSVIGNGANDLTKMASHTGVGIVSDTAASVAETATKGEDIELSTFTSGAVGGAAGGAWDSHKSEGDGGGHDGGHDESERSGSEGSSNEGGHDESHHSGSESEGPSNEGAHSESHTSGDSGPGAPARPSTASHGSLNLD